MSADLLSRYRQVRSQTMALTGALSPEDACVQSMPDASPAKWHLAHTTWFFETFVLQSAADRYQPVHPAYGFLFNSYYNAVGERHPRPRRGLLTRPSFAEICDYRRTIDDRIEHLLNAGLPDPLVPILQLGLHHEQQHQELLLTDVKHLFWCNPLRPPLLADSAANPSNPAPPPDAVQPGRDRGASSGNSASSAGIGFGRRPKRDLDLRWIEFGGGLCEIGHGGDGFAYDNEGPPHQVFLNRFALADRLVTNGEFVSFIVDGGYHRTEWWLSDGWDALQAGSWEHPLYWEWDEQQGWSEFTPQGMRPLALDQPVCHVSFYEADAFARWAGFRLLTEAEWETAARSTPISGNFLDNRLWHPVAAPENSEAPVRQMFGDVWEWTASPYVAYPGYRPPDGALGEYNGKFMCNQLVLRGGSCATPRSHIRATYRNFFKPEARWQLMGVRLARDC